MAYQVVDCPSTSRLSDDGPAPVRRDAHLRLVEDEEETEYRVAEPVWRIRASGTDGQSTRPCAGWTMVFDRLREARSALE